MNSILYGLAGLLRIPSRVAEYIGTQRDKYAPLSVPLTKEQNAGMADFFSPQLLASARVLVLEGSRIENPSFYRLLAKVRFLELPDVSQSAATTFYDVIVSHEPFSAGLLFHELVHVEQYRQLGIKRFSELYVRGLLQCGGYDGIPLEVNAYVLGGEFECDPAGSFSVEEEVANWVREGKF